ncbi:MAG TPA: hypothetical protein VJP40_09685 [bacterium]|nr:hypothetical protein [bacterium]
MPNDFLQETGISAAVGCATGFLWSALAGQADLGEGKGWLFAGAGCAGSAVNAAGLYSGSRYASDNRELARIAAGSWLGLQGASSFTNYLGLKNQWYEKPAFNAVALPLNYLAAPALSTLSLGLAGLSGFNGYTADPFVLSGTVVIPHQFCLGFNRAQLGAVGHECNSQGFLRTKFHEVGHAVQSSIMGDLGITVISGLNLLFLPRYKERVVEQWADDYADQIDLTYYLRRRFPLPEDVAIDKNEIGLMRVRLRESFALNGRVYSAAHPLLFGQNIQGEIVLVEGMLDRDTKVEGNCYRQGTILEYSGTGKVERASWGGFSEMIEDWRKPAPDAPFLCRAPAGL